MQAASLLLSMLIGTIGLAYFVYGKKSTEIWFMLSGAALMGYPYFVEGLLLTAIIGIALGILPFVMRRV